MALIITRRTNEGFYIGDDIKVTVIATQGGQAKIAIDAPRDINIRREELEPKSKR